MTDTHTAEHANGSAGDLSDRVAVVTGAAAGIGSAIATALAAAGAAVVALDRDGDGAAATAEACGPGSSSMTLDVSREEDVAQAMSNVVARVGRIDILVNAAGVLGETASLLDVSGSEWNRIFAINTLGSFLCLKEAAAHMLAGRHGGSIVNVASIAAKEGRADFAPYAASKAAVLSLTWSSAVRLAPDQIRVNALCPAAVDTDFWQRIENIKQEEGAEPGATRASRAAAIPLGRFALPREVAAAALYLCSDDAAFVTGSSIDLTGAAHTGS
jgi:NAD(P)-dependent dehydrogenase (short-subunit alcohol dehydrogenase family)